MEDYDAIYGDTRRYVYRIIASAIIGENPGLFGFDGIVPESPVLDEVVQVPGNTRLSVFARACGADVEELRELNPSLLVSTTPDREIFDLRIPFGTMERFIEEYDGIDLDGDDGHFVHRLRFGETVAHLSRVLGIREHAIRHVNGLGRRERVPYGTELIIPLDPASAEASLSAYEAGAGRPDEEHRPVVITPSLQFDYPDMRMVFYEIQRGDNLYDIAEAFGVSPFELGTWNDVDPSAEIHIHAAESLRQAERILATAILEEE